MGAARFPTARILIVDDEPANVLLLERLLTQAGYRHLRSLTDSRTALQACADFQPDLILLDLLMPHLDGYAVLEALRGQGAADGALPPALVLTADITREARERALGLGAKDFVTKPFERTEALLRIGNLLETRALHVRLRDQNRLLEAQVRERTRALLEAQIEILERLGRAAEFRDDATGQHTQRVGHGAAQLAQALGLPEEQVELIRRAAPLHDIGKIGIPDAILLKPGRLTPDEFAVMQAHTTGGAALLAHGCSELLRMAEVIALTHHERWDGSGYPQALQADTIPLAGRILAVVDVFDALTHDRPYKRAWTVEAAVAELKRQRGRQLDANLVHVLGLAPTSGMPRHAWPF
jgi:putative two-component system response regulator